MSKEDFYRSWVERSPDEPIQGEAPPHDQAATEQAYAQWLAAKRAQAAIMRRVRLIIIALCILIGLWLLFEPFVSAGI